MGEIAVEQIDDNNPPFPLTAIDRALLSMRDEDFHRMSWNDLKQIIADNKFEELTRLPSDLRRYLAWSHGIKQQYGSLTTYVIQERLHWAPLPSTDGPPLFAHESSTPFADRRDYAVLPNDWPYGLAEGIAHMLVWSKTPIAVDDARGDVTAESRRVIQEFVERYFVRRLEDGREKVMWFKNWVSLQSVRSVDHIHVLVRDAPGHVLETWTERKDL